jgi:hypothetical protein
MVLPRPLPENWGHIHEDPFESADRNWFHRHLRLYGKEMAVGLEFDPLQERQWQRERATVNGKLLPSNVFPPAAISASTRPPDRSNRCVDMFGTLQGMSAEDIDELGATASCWTRRNKDRRGVGGLLAC